VPDLLKLKTTGTCYAISAKRYAIYQRTADGTIQILKRSEHGLGHYPYRLAGQADRVGGVAAR